MNDSSDFSGKFPFPLTVVAGDEVEDELMRLRQECWGKALVPVILGEPEMAMDLMELWDEAFDVEAEMERAREMSAEEWFAERKDDEESYVLDRSQQEIHPAGTAAMTRLTVGYDHSGEPYPEVVIATIPAPDATEVPIFLRFGDWNACPSPSVHAALAKYWGARFGAEIATMCGDVVEYTVDRPPTSDAEALELAWQQYFYCADIVDQGVGSVATLAQALRKSTRWFFWWD